MFLAEKGSGMPPDRIVESAEWAICNYQRDNSLEECKRYIQWLIDNGKLSETLKVLIRQTGDAALIALIQTHH